MKFTLSYAVGLAGFWAGLALAAQYVSGGMPATVVFGLPVLGAICVFALTFIALTRRPLKIGFWAIAICLTALVAFLTVSLILQGIVTPLEGGLIALAVHLGSSFFLMRRVW